MTKLSVITTAPGGVLATDRIYLVRGDGASPETFEEYSASVEELLTADSGTIYDFGCAFEDAPESNVVIQRVPIGRNIEIPAGFTGSFGVVDTNPDASYAIDVQDDGTSIFTITVATDGTVTFSNGGSAIEIDAGSIVTFVSPSTSPPETTIAGAAFLVAARVR